MATPWRIEPQWAGETCVIVASGPSLRREDVEYCRGRARVIVVNDNYILAPWADLLYFADGNHKWYLWHKDKPAFKAFAGRKVTINQSGAPADPSIFMVRYVDHGGKKGLCDEPDCIESGRNSGYQAINIAVHLGVKRIVLLGFDMKARSKEQSHWFGDHPSGTNITLYNKTFIPRMRALPPDLARRGVEVINATRDTALDVFPMMSLEEALAGKPVAEKPLAPQNDHMYYRPIEERIVRISIPAVKLVKAAKQMCAKNGFQCPEGETEIRIDPERGPELIIRVDAKGV